jgi:hypothetical protein
MIVFRGLKWAPNADIGRNGAFGDCLFIDILGEGE